MTVTPNEWLSFPEIAAQTGIPEANLRRWRKQFPGWCPSKIFGRAEKFRPEVLAIFQIIGRMYGERKTREEIAASLQAESAPVIDLDASPTKEASSHPSTQAQDFSQVLGLLGPVANRYLEVMERQAQAMERANELQAKLVAATEQRVAFLEHIALEAHIRPIQALKNKKHRIVHGDDENGCTWQIGGKSREDIIAEVHRLHKEGLGASAIATALRKADLPTLSGRGKWGKGVVARILKGVITQ